ncbi:Emopamil-binding protein [Lactarius vividus]|nr:Emopamil-binding protein [Lactarius vividus]
MLEASQPSVFTATSAYSLAGVAGIALVASTAARALLPKNAPWQDRVTFIWLPPRRERVLAPTQTFDALIHFIFEGSFLALSTFGRTVNGSSGAYAQMWREYAAADTRWGIADPTVVSLELLTVLGAGPLAALIVYQIVRRDPVRHYWIVVLSTAELYGGWMTFCPEWLTGSPSLNTSNPLFLWVYLVFMNTIWVIIPVWLMCDSYTHIAGTLRSTQTNKPRKAD